MRTQLNKHRFASILKLSVLLGTALCVSVGQAGEPHQWFAGTYLDPAIQRPDFFPHTISRSIPEYRQVYNRPRNLTGWIAYKVEPSSQEAMAWQTNHCNGNYQNNAGAYIPMYCYPKPWESLNTRGRPGQNYGGTASGQAARIDAQSNAEIQSNADFPESAPVESVPGKKLKAVPESSTDIPGRRLGVEVAPPAASLK